MLEILRIHIFMYRIACAYPQSLYCIYYIGIVILTCGQENCNLYSFCVNGSFTSVYVYTWH